MPSWEPICVDQQSPRSSFTSPSPVEIVEPPSSRTSSRCSWAQPVGRAPRVPGPSGSPGPFRRPAAPAGAGRRRPARPAVAASAAVFLPVRLGRRRWRRAGRRGSPRAVPRPPRSASRRLAGVDPVVGVERLAVGPDREDREEGDQGCRAMRSATTALGWPFAAAALDVSSAIPRTYGALTRVASPHSSELGDAAVEDAVEVALLVVSRNGFVQLHASPRGRRGAASPPGCRSRAPRPGASAGPGRGRRRRGQGAASAAMKGRVKPALITRRSLTSSGLRYGEQTAW